MLYLKISIRSVYTTLQRITDFKDFLSISIPNNVLKCFKNRNVAQFIL